jgi:hypothetical protein
MADFLGVEADYQKTFRTARFIVKHMLAALSASGRRIP